MIVDNFLFTLVTSKKDVYSVSGQFLNYEYWEGEGNKRTLKSSDEWWLCLWDLLDLFFFDRLERPGAVFSKGWNWSWLTGWKDVGSYCWAESCSTARTTLGKSVDGKDSGGRAEKKKNCLKLWCMTHSMLFNDHLQLYSLWHLQGYPIWSHPELFSYLFDWCFTPHSGIYMYHLYNGGQHYGGKKLGNTQRKS